VRGLRIVCAVTVLTLLGFAAALKLPAAPRAQGKTPALPSSQTSSIKADSSTTQPTLARTQTGANSAQTPATANALITVAANISARSLAVESQSQNATNAASAENSNVAQSALVYLANADKGNRIFTLATASNVLSTANNPTAAVSAGSTIALFAGQAAAGSLGDGGAASSAEFDLKLNSLAMRSGVVLAPDGTVFVADTLNETIRSIAGASSSEPGIVRGLVGRFGPRQNFELIEPLGLALDHAGNLYIADRGANAVLMLHSAASDSPGVLEILAHVVSPASVGVSPDGSKVFAASPDTGSIVEINTKTSSISTSAISPSQWFAASQNPAGARIIPTGLAVDGAGNLFVSFSGPGGGLDQIWRLDATTGKMTSAARGLTSPGELAFDSNGNLFIADQGTHRLLELRGAGVPATGVTLTPPAGPVPTDFRFEPVDGKTASQAFTLTNDSGGTLSQVGASFQSGTTNFSVASSSCTATVLNDTTCAFNVVFTPQSTGVLSDNLVVTYTAGTNPPATLTAAVTGTGDDYQITPVTNVGPIYQIAIDPGLAATFLLQVVPDDSFSGAVTLNCPVALPTNTTCGISVGSTVTTPLVASLTVNVVRGAPVPFNITFQTTGPNTKVPTSSGFLPTIRSPRGGPNGPAAPAHLVMQSFGLTAFAALAMLVALLCAIFGTAFFPQPLPRPNAMRTICANLFHDTFSGTALLRLISTAAVIVLFVAVLASCGGGSGSGKPKSTPAGTTNLIVQGTAQNATRGFTVTLVVN
jgi:sugar lactone lactonase YvrE